MSKKIAICHYRVGGTDGVGLEIEKRQKILQDLGCEVKLIAGERSKGADYNIKELEWDNGIIPIIKENGFIYFRRKDLSDSDLEKRILSISKIIEKQLVGIQKKERFDAVLIHNIFSFGGHIAAARAFARWIEKFNLPAIATHHDFYWERKEFTMPRNGYLRKHLRTYMPPNLPSIKHVMINSIAQKELKRRRGINSDVIGDIFDFEGPRWSKTSFNKTFLKDFFIKDGDLVILQATRIIPRKGIEISLDFAKQMQKQFKRLRSKKIYNGKKLNKNSRVVLILAGYAEDEKRNYLYKLKAKAFDERIRTVFVSDHVKAKRSLKDGQKTYSLWDAYVHADLVTFPSIWEGWGNQFIEAVFAEKPIVAFEYPVFKSDIKKEGYEYISLGDKIESKDKNDLIKIPAENIQSAAEETERWLLDKNTNKKLEKNFQLGKKYHGHSVVENFLARELGL